MAETAKAMRVTNPELQAMAKIDEILAPMSGNARGRVVSWIISTYASVDAGERPAEATGQ